MASPCVKDIRSHCLYPGLCDPPFLCPGTARLPGGRAFDDQTWTSCLWGHWVLFTYTCVLRSSEVTHTHHVWQNTLETKYSALKWCHSFTLCLISFDVRSLLFVHFDVTCVHMCNKFIYKTWSAIKSEYFLIFLSLLDIFLGFFTLWMHLYMFYKTINKGKNQQMWRDFKKFKKSQKIDLKEWKSTEKWNCVVCFLATRGQCHISFSVALLYWSSWCLP